MDIQEFYKSNYTVRFLNTLRQYWRDEKKWSCIGNPKAHHLFLYLDGCSAIYISKNGRKTEAKSGDMIYVPAGAEYNAEFFDFENDTSSTVSANFFLYDSDGKFITEADGIKAFSSPNIKVNINELERLSYSIQHIPAKCNVQIYNIFNILGDEESKVTVYHDGFGTIRKGVEHLHKHCNEKVNIQQLADMCNISEVYFRKLFKVHMKTSPTEYKTNLRLELACRYLKYSESPISEISETLGFADTSYFIKSFKEHFGVTPLNYRKYSV